MHFEHRFVVSGRPQDVLEQFADAPLTASMFPGATVEPAGEDGVHPATLVVSFGPKRIAFKGQLTNRVNRTALVGTIVGQANTDVRGARMTVTMHYALAPTSPHLPEDSPPASGDTEVRITSDAQLSGVLAEFAKSGGVIVAEALIAEFSRRFSAHMKSQAAGQVFVTPESGATLSLTAVLMPVWRRLRERIMRRVRQVGLIRRGRGSSEQT